ncbi:hypothetical protein FKP32DRAFT_1590492 [Trametes sanguinea]|nr:hypothetical protein FKP32DRAFT_1590492 [Trametes sanguinea]
MPWSAVIGARSTQPCSRSCFRRVPRASSLDEPAPLLSIGINPRPYQVFQEAREISTIRRSSLTQEIISAPTLSVSPSARTRIMVPRLREAVRTGLVPGSRIHRAGCARHAHRRRSMLGVEFDHQWVAGRRMCWRRGPTWTHYLWHLEYPIDCSPRVI